MHTVQQVKVLLGAADALPDTTLLSYGDDEQAEAAYRRAIDVLDSLGMIGQGVWHPDDMGGFEAVDVHEPCTGDRLCTLYGPRGVKCLASVQPMQRLVAVALGESPEGDAA